MSAMYEMTRISQAKTAKQKTLADLAVVILGKEWPLSLNAIHQKITKEHEKAASIQATHKSLARLVKQNVLLKQQKRYRLNQKWLEQVNNFSTQAKEAYAVGDVQKPGFASESFHQHNNQPCHNFVRRRR